MSGGGGAGNMRRNEMPRGGWSWHRSHVGEGTAFHVVLGAASGHAEEATVDDTPALGGDERILLVDDELAIIALPEESLDRLGGLDRARQPARDFLDLAPPTDPIKASLTFRGGCRGFHDPRLLLSS